jgi:tetratricopeptide (TPR) repeat protein
MIDSQENTLKTLKLAQAAFTDRDYRGALDAYRQVVRNLSQEPENQALIEIEIGWCHYLLEEYEATIATLEKVIKQTPLDEKQTFDCLRLIGFSHEFCGNSDRAIAWLQDAMKREVSDFDKRYACFELGKIFFNQNYTAEARPYLEQALAQFEDDDQAYRQSAHYYLGFIEFYLGRNDKARHYFNTYIKNAPDDHQRAPGYFGLAHIFYENREYPALIDTCEKVILLDADFFDKETLSFFLCMGYMYQKMWDQLALFLPNLKMTYPDGRYKSAYPILEKSLQMRRVPVRKSQA